MVRGARRRSFCCSGVCSRQTSTGGPQSFLKAGTASTNIRSTRRRVVHAPDMPARLVRSAVVLKPSTLLRFHQALKRRKYRLLFSPTNGAGVEADNVLMYSYTLRTLERNRMLVLPRRANRLSRETVSFRPLASISKRLVPHV